MRVKSFEDIVKADLCAGCGLCASIAGHQNISIEINKVGFYRPRVQQLGKEAWQEIQQVCPAIRVKQERNEKVSEDEKVWGPVRSVWTGYATDTQMRWRASSGGALSAFLAFLLDSKLADYVVHVGVGDNPFLPTVCLSYTRQEILNNAGSRYAPSSPLTNLVELLQRDREVFAFVGKPCDVAALKAYARLHPGVEQRIVAYISFFCAGVPSLLATYDLVQALGVDKSQVEKLRYRGCGWPGQATVLTKDGQEYSMSYNDSWGKILGRHLQLRCKICPDGAGELADISFGDAWYLRDGRPDFEERPGRTLIMVRTEKGQRFLDAIRDSGKLVVESFALEQLAMIQPYQKIRRMSILPRLLALRLTGKPIPRYEGFHLVRNAVKAGPFSFVRQFLGMLYRVLPMIVGKVRR